MASTDPKRPAKTPFAAAAPAPSPVEGSAQSAVVWPAPSASGRAVLIAAVLLVLAGLVAYHNSFSGPFIFDDPSSIVSNPTIRTLWPPWAPLAPPNAAVTVQGRPILNFSLAFNYTISGTNVWSYHALNLAIHLAAGLALFGLVRRTLRGRAGFSPPSSILAASESLSAVAGESGLKPALPQNALQQHALPLAFAIALLWIVHPLQTEAVTYTIQRAESLMGFFYLFTVYAFVRAIDCHIMGDNRPIRDAEGAPVSDRRWPSSAQLATKIASPETPVTDRRYPEPRRSHAWLALSAIACALGMATKEVMVSAPILVLLYDRAFVAGTFRAAFQQRKIYYATLAATWIVLALCVASTGGNRGGAAGFDVGVKWWDYELTQFRAIAHYLRLALWPAPLVFEYGSFWIDRFTDVLLEMVFILALAGATLFAIAKKPVWGFLGGWFFASLAVTSFVPGTTQMIVEHRMYLPLAAVIIVLVLGVHRWLGGRLVWLWLIPAIVFLGLTIRRNADYRSELAIWADTVAKRPGNALAHEMLGQALDRAGRSDEAAAHHANALQIFPSFTVAHVSLGDDLMRREKIAEAIAHYEAALKAKPDYVDAHHELGIALARAGRRDEALAHLETTLRLKPDFADAHFDLANVLAALNRTPEAATHYERALKLRSDYPSAHFNYANLLADTGHPADAVPHYLAAITQRPDYPEAFNNLGGAFLDLGRNEEAAKSYKEALKLRPDFRDAQENLARVRAALK